MANEARVLDKVLMLLNARGAYYLRMANAPIGTPDVIACVDGRFFGIEVKDDANGKYRLTGAQKLRGQEIQHAGGIFIVVDKNTVRDLNETIDDWLRVKGE